jgi:sugar lactone lactonase YvrE
MLRVLRLLRVLAMSRLRLTLTLAALAALAACDRDARTAAPPPPTATTAEVPAPTVPAPTDPGSTDPGPSPRPTPAPVDYRGGAGPAYLGVDGAGLFRLDGGVVTKLIEHPYSFHEVALGPDGVVFASAIGGLWKLGRGAPENLEHNAPQLIQQIAVGPDGVLWATDRSAVHRWDGTWTEEPAATFAGPDPLIEDLAVDRDGRVWVVKASALWRLDGDRWNQLDISFTGTSEPYFSAIAMHPDGSVYVACIRGTFVFADGAWRRTGLTGRYGSLDELVIGPAGHVAGSGGVGTIAVQTPTGAVRTADVDDGPARAKRGDVLAVDGTGRTWVTTDHGLVIFDRDGGLAQQWLPGTVAGITGKVTAVAVIGDGPTLPTLTAAATGTIVGKVLRAGKPVAGADLELCDLPLTMFRRTPCEASTVRYRATTAPDGTFALPDVPVGSYGFAVKPGAQWVILLGGSCCEALTAGGRYDVGAITLD